MMEEFSDELLSLMTIFALTHCFDFIQFYMNFSLAQKNQTVFDQ